MYGNGIGSRFGLLTGRARDHKPANSRSASVRPQLVATGLGVDRLIDKGISSADADTGERQKNSWQKNKRIFAGFFCCEIFCLLIHEDPVGGDGAGDFSDPVSDF